MNVTLHLVNQLKRIFNKIKAVSNLRAISDSVTRPFNVNKIFPNKIALMMTKTCKTTTTTTTSTVTTPQKLRQTTKFMSNLIALDVSFWCSSHHHSRHECHRTRWGCWGAGVRCFEGKWMHEWLSDIGRSKFAVMAVRVYIYVYMCVCVSVRWASSFRSNPLQWH